MRSELRRILKLLLQPRRFLNGLSSRLEAWRNPLARQWRKIVCGNCLIGTPRSGANPARRRVLFYAPEAFVGPHLLAQQILARAVVDAGHEVLFSHCHRLFERCVPKESMNLPSDAPAIVGKQICAACIDSCVKLMTPTKLIGFSLSKAIPGTIRKTARDIVAALPDESLAKFVLDAIPFGELCRHDLVLMRKLMLDTRLEAEHYLYLRQNLKTVVATYLGMKDFLPAAGFTDVVLYGQYAANIAVICAARKAGISWRLLANINHLGVDRRRTHINFAQTHVWTTRFIGEWPEWRSLPLARDEIEETGEDILIRFGSKSFTTYSPPKTCDQDVFSALELDRKRRLVVAFTSSLDEYQAEEILDEVLGFPKSEPTQRPYADQIEWLTRLAGEIGGRRDLQLVVRIHPREDANKRDGVRSRHLDILHERLSGLPSNVKIVWPSDPISSYDLIEVADLVQVWSSTIGLESARLGIPVIKVFRGYASYPEGDFAVSAPTHEGILAVMDEALAQPPDFERLVKAWRFYGYSRFAGSIDLRDVVPDSQLAALPDYRRPIRLRELTRAVFEQTPTWTINREAPDFMASRLPQDAEADAIRRQLARVVHAVFTGGHPPADVPLHISDAASAGKDRPDGSFAAEESNCTYVWGGKLYARYSPMCVRLAAFSAQDTVPGPALEQAV